MQSCDLSKECYQYKIDKENITPGDIKRNSENYRVTTLFDGQDNIALMTEIQLKNIVDRLGKETVTGTDGDDFTIKDGIKVSKFSKEAMKIGFDVNKTPCWRRLRVPHQKWLTQNSHQVRGKSLLIRTTSGVWERCKEDALYQGHELGRENIQLPSHKKLHTWNPCCWKMLES